MKPSVFPWKRRGAGSTRRTRWGELENTARPRNESGKKCWIGGILQRRDPKVMKNPRKNTIGGLTEKITKTRVRITKAEPNHKAAQEVNPTKDPPCGKGARSDHVVNHAVRCIHDVARCTIRLRAVAAIESRRSPQKHDNLQFAWYLSLREKGSVSLRNRVTLSCSR